MKKLTFICLLLMLSGCATTMEYGKGISNWFGHTVDELYAKLGKPSSTQPQPDGGKIIEYEHSEVVQDTPENKGTAPEDKSAPQSAPTENSATIAGSGQATGQSETSATATPPPNTRTVSCTTRYRVDSSGVIRSWTLDGNGCKAYEEPYSKHP